MAKKATATATATVVVMSDLHICPACGQQSAKYWHRLSPGIVGALVKFRLGVKQAGKNDLHINTDLIGDHALTTSEAMNWTKLRFHGLVAKVYDENGERLQGRWLLTSRGRRFLDGTLSVPVKVQTLNNKVIGRSDQTVTVRDVLKNYPRFDDYAYWHSSKETQPLEVSQQRLAL